MTTKKFHFFLKSLPEEMRCLAKVINAFVSAEVYSKPCQASKMGQFSTMVNG